MESLTRALRSIHERHEKIKHTVHTAWRYPLPKWGQYAMGCVYFTVPIVGGWCVMQWAISKSVDEIGARGEKLRHKQLQGYGNKTVIDGREEKIGAGGKYGGVNLAVSGSSTQENNRIMLEAMFRKERKKREKGKQQNEQ
mmetsp:Transcript_16218/g.34275  ORF Transcript_16218/g.34275 Transcript_16218/m.34275 type:complete len:140 (-) Transcript_16218:223-642(-)